jgi:uncharacterized protein YhfF
MPTDSRITAYWERFTEQHPAYAGRSCDAWEFGDNSDMADVLGHLVRSGVKTATAALYWEYEFDGDPIAPVGEIGIVLDGAGKPLRVVETTEVEIRPFNEVGAAFAYDEGEGDRSLAYWRDAHWQYFSRRCEVIGREPSEIMPVVCQRFRLLFSD